MSRIEDIEEAIAGNTFSRMTIAFEIKRLREEIKKKESELVKLDQLNQSLEYELQILTSTNR